MNDGVSRSINMSNEHSLNSQSALEVLNLNAKRVEQLTARRTRIQVQLETAQANYDKAVKEANEMYGTADLPKLRALLEEKVVANNKAVAEFVKALNTFEAHIDRIEKALVDPEALDEYLQDMPSSEEVFKEEEVASLEPKEAPEFDEEDI